MSATPSPRALRWHLARHNALALGLAAASAVGATLLWGSLVLGTYWFTLLGATISRGMDAGRAMEIFDARDLVGTHFWPGLGVGAAGLLLLGVAVRRGRWAERLREGRFSLLWLPVEILLLAPGALFAVWGNLRALVWLGAGDRALAWALLQAVGKHERRGVPLTLRAAAAEVGATARSLPALQRACFALQLAGLIELRAGTGEGWRLTLAGAEARALCAWSPGGSPADPPGP